MWMHEADQNPAGALTNLLLGWGERHWGETTRTAPGYWWHLTLRGEQWALMAWKQRAEKAQMLKGIHSSQLHWNQWKYKSLNPPEKWVRRKYEEKSSHWARRHKDVLSLCLINFLLLMNAFVSTWAFRMAFSSTNPRYKGLGATVDELHNSLHPLNSGITLWSSKRSVIIPKLVLSLIAISNSSTFPWIRLICWF